MSKVLTGNEKIKLVGNISKSEITVKELLGLIETPESISKEDIEKLINLSVSAINKESLGLGKVSNTEDSNKPVSQPQKNFIQEGLNSKLDKPSGKPEEGATIVFRSGSWVIENPKLV